MTSDETPPFAEVLTAAVRDRGLSLERIRARLEAAGVPVSIATLSYWQSGRSMPTRSRSYHTLVELEQILNLDPGHLTRHTHTADGRSRRESFAWQKVVPSHELVTSIIQELGIDMQGQMTRLSIQDVMVVGPDRLERTHDTRVVWRAERPGLHRWAVVVQQDDGGTGVPSIEARFGCEVGEVIEVPERHLMVAEVVARRPLQRGGVIATEHRITLADTSKPSFRLQRAVSDQMKLLSLGVTFHPDAVPSAVRSGFMAATDDTLTDVADVVLTRNEAQVAWTDPRPGLYSLLWDWD